MKNSTCECSMIPWRPSALKARHSQDVPCVLASLFFSFLFLFFFLFFSVLFLRSVTKFYRLVNHPGMSIEVIDLTSGLRSSSMILPPQLYCRGSGALHTRPPPPPPLRSDVLVEEMWNLSGIWALEKLRKELHNTLILLFVLEYVAWA